MSSITSQIWVVKVQILYVMLAGYHKTWLIPSVFIYSHSVKMQFHGVLVLCLLSHPFHLISHHRYIFSNHLFTAFPPKAPFVMLHTVWSEALMVGLFFLFKSGSKQVVLTLSSRDSSMLLEYSFSWPSRSGRRLSMSADRWGMLETQATVRSLRAGVAKVDWDPWKGTQWQTGLVSSCPRGHFGSAADVTTQQRVIS